MSLDIIHEPRGTVESVTSALAELRAALERQLAQFDAPQPVNLSGLAALLNAIALYAALKLNPSIESLHAIYRAQGDTRTPAPAQTRGVGAPIPCSIGFVFGRGYVDGGAK